MTIIDVWDEVQPFKDVSVVISGDNASADVVRAFYVQILHRRRTDLVSVRADAAFLVLHAPPAFVKHFYDLDRLEEGGNACLSSMFADVGNTDYSDALLHPDFLVVLSEYCLEHDERALSYAHILLENSRTTEKLLRFWFSGPRYHILTTTLESKYAVRDPCLLPRLARETVRAAGKLFDPCVLEPLVEQVMFNRGDFHSFLNRLAAFKYLTKGGDDDVFRIFDCALKGAYVDTLGCNLETLACVSCDA